MADLRAKRICAWPRKSRVYSTSRSPKSVDSRSRLWLRAAGSTASYAISGPVSRASFRFSSGSSDSGAARGGAYPLLPVTWALPSYRPTCSFWPGTSCSCAQNRLFPSCTPAPRPRCVRAVQAKAISEYSTPSAVFSDRITVLTRDLRAYNLPEQPCGDCFRMRTRY